MNERRPIPSMPHYSIDEVGNVFRSDGKPMKQSRSTNGYPQVHLRLDGGAKTRTVHTLVAEAFIGPRPKGNHVCHWNGIKTDNRASNLRYATPKENVADNIRLGAVATGDRHNSRTVPESVARGEKQWLASFTNDQVSQIKERLKNYKYGMVSAIAREFGVHHKTISNIKNGVQWRSV